MTDNDFDFKEKSPRLRVDETELHSTDQIHSASPTAPTNSSDQVHSAASTAQTNRCGKYSLVELVAKGAAGEVWRALDEHGTTVALKLFPKELLSNKDALQRFHQEAKTLRRVSHPNVVSILDSGESTDGAPYIVMEFIHGQTLKALLEQQEALQPKDAAKYAREICRALIAAHAETVIHRDLKPSNVIITDKNDVKLIDFGIAKSLGYSGETLTQFGGIVGTPEYMSPEQCLGQPVDARSDIYSLGCTLFEMLTGTKAFEAKSPVEAIAKQLHADRTSIHSRLSATGAPALQNIVMKCLEREPNNRYQSVAEVEFDLGAFLLDAPLRYTRSRKRKRKLIAISALALIACAFQLLLNHPGKVNTVTQSRIASPVVPHRWHRGRGPAGTIVIKNRVSQAVIFSDADAYNVKEAVEDAVDKGISLSYADLAAADLTQARIDGADFSFANLSGAAMDQVQLNGAKLEGVNLEGADMTQVKLQEANLNNANVSRATLTQAQLNHASCRNTNFEGSRFTQARFDYADLRDAIFTNAELGSASVVHANCSYAHFDSAQLFCTCFDWSILKNASFAGTNPQEVTAISADLAGTGMHLDKRNKLAR